MLRKSSRKQRELLAEQERLAREAHANRPAPHISLNPLATISSFAGEIGDQHYIADTSNTNSAGSSFVNGQAKAPANFSRPGGMASQPANTAARTSNGENVDAASERGESMRNRGRYSYASSVSPANVSSPRRVRRRKDPTPFK
jgi:hypothetical protein